MKKLINLFETVTNVNINQYPYLDFPSRGSSAPASDKINDVLLSDINAATKAAGLTKTSITTAVSGHRAITSSGKPSRHTGGTAVDIAMINGKAITKQTGDALVAQLKAMGYDTSGNESGHSKAILWQVADHFNHVHVSNTTGSPSSPSDASGLAQTSNDTSGLAQPSNGDSGGGTNRYAAAANGIVTGALSGGLKQMGMMSESKLEKNISKIRKLLK